MSGANTELLKVARILKSNGIEGEILMGFREIDPEDLNLKEPVFINFDGLPVPFFIESFSRKGTSRALVHLTGLKCLADAEEIVGKDVFAKEDAIEGYEDDEEGLTIEDLPGWDLLDADGNKVGTISDYEDIPGNPCIYLETEDGQVMVPLHEDLILSVDEDSRSITMDLPEGLV